MIMTCRPGLSTAKGREPINFTPTSTALLWKTASEGGEGGIFAKLFFLLKMHTYLAFALETDTPKFDCYRRRNWSPMTKGHLLIA